MVEYLIQSPMERFARTTPEKIAVAIDGQTMSYQELDSASNRFANKLIANGASPQDRVGLFVHKSLELVVAMFGALKAGCVFVPIDPFTPADRLKFIIDDCEINHLVSSDIQYRTLSEFEAERPLCLYGVSKTLQGSCIQYDWESINKQRDSNPDVIIIDQDLGYIMYTSGSTGIPKGMMHTHHGSVTYAEWGLSYVNMTCDDRVASHAPLHFDLSIFDFFSTFRAGATVVLVPESITKFPASWTQYIEQEKISIVFTVPYTLTTMMEQGAMEKRDLSSLRWILFGGEPFPPKTLRVLMEKLEHCRFSNIYGPAEAPCCTCYEVPRPLTNLDDALPIGLVSSNSADLIIDENQQECVDGESGELCIRSSTLMKGYWNRPDLNIEAFLSINTPGRLPLLYYRTGDRVARHADGQLRFLGRMDRMVKTRGHRVELDEVEAVLADHPAVYEVAAFTIPDQHGSRSIVSAVTAKPETIIEAGDLLKLARTKLPPYAVPVEIVTLDSMPHTSTGKIDRKLLVKDWNSNNL